jgi:hypothetical protein
VELQGNLVVVVVVVAVVTGLTAEQRPKTPNFPSSFFHCEDSMLALLC